MWVSSYRYVACSLHLLLLSTSRTAYAVPEIPSNLNFHRSCSEAQIVYTLEAFEDAAKAAFRADYLIQLLLQPEPAVPPGQQATYSEYRGIVERADARRLAWTIFGIDADAVPDHHAHLQFIARKSVTGHRWANHVGSSELKPDPDVLAETAYIHEGGLPDGDLGWSTDFAQLLIVCGDDPEPEETHLATDVVAGSNPPEQYGQKYPELLADGENFSVFGGRITVFPGCQNRKRAMITPRLDMMFLCDVFFTLTDSIVASSDNGRITAGMTIREARGNSASFVVNHELAHYARLEGET